MVLGIKEGLVECAKVCIKSVVMLRIICPCKEQRTEKALKFEYSSKATKVWKKNSYSFEHTKYSQTKLVDS